MDPAQGGQFYYIRGLGLVRNTADIGNIIVQEKNGIPVQVKDIAHVEIGHAPRLGQFGYMRQEEAVEGVILMRAALMGVAVQTSVILYSFINKLRLEGHDILTATLEASLLRLRPITMTALVACFGLLPAAMSTGIGSDSQKPFAIVIVGGLTSRLLLSVFPAPVLYAVAARDGDTLRV